MPRQHRRCFATSTAMRMRLPQPSRPPIQAPATQLPWRLLQPMRQGTRRLNHRAMWASPMLAASSRTSPSRRTQEPASTLQQDSRQRTQQGSRLIRPLLLLPAVQCIHLPEERIHHRHSLGTVLRPDMEQLHSTASSQHLTLPTRPLPMLQLAMGWDKVRTTTCSSLLLDPGWWLMEATRVRRARLHKHSRSLKRNCSPTPSRRQTQPSQPAAWDAGLQPRISSPNSSTWIWFGSCLTCP
mmetsp:Transcript_103068/g.245497  ORF Transcript_103068/g.245497 Transcript_103068/m.245497 type:complete len:240 (-) Transcript_103068:315-1034(-)